MRIGSLFLVVMLEHTAQVRVRYAETDQMGVVYHANYIVWMEVSRVEAMRAAGVNYSEMEAEGLRVAVLGVSVDYKVAARYDDLVNVTMRVTELQSRMMKVSYEMHREGDGVLLATGETRHLFMDFGMKPMRLPERYRAVFAATARE